MWAALGPSGFEDESSDASHSRPGPTPRPPGLESHFPLETSGAARPVGLQPTTPRNRSRSVSFVSRLELVQRSSHAQAESRKPDGSHHGRGRSTERERNACPLDLRVGKKPLDEVDRLRSRVDSIGSLRTFPVACEWLRLYGLHSAINNPGRNREPSMAEPTFPKDIRSTAGRTWVSGAAWVLAQHLASLVQFLLHAALAILLSPAAFAEFGVAMAAIGLLALPGFGFQWITARESTPLNDGRERAPRVPWAVGLAALAIAYGSVALIVFAIDRPIAGLRSSLITVALALAAISIAHQTGLGALIGRSDRKGYSGKLVGAALSRVTLAIGLVLGYRLASDEPAPTTELILVALIIGTGLPWLRVVRTRLFTDGAVSRAAVPTRTPVAQFLGAILTATLLHGGFIAITFIDVLFVQWHYDTEPEVVASYSLASIFGRAIVHATAALTVLGLPRLRRAQGARARATSHSCLAASGHLRPHRNRREPRGTHQDASVRATLSLWTLGALALGALAALAIHLLAPVVLTDTKYANAVPLMRAYAWAALPLVGAQVALAACVALGRMRPGLLVLAALALESVLLAWKPESPIDMIHRLGAVALLLWISLLLSTRRPSR